MVEYISYKNKKYPVRVGYYALKHATREVEEKNPGVKVEMEDVLSGNMEIYEPLLFHSLVMGAKAMDKELTDIKREDMEFVLDECLFEFIAIIPKFFPGGSESDGLGKLPKKMGKK